MCVCMCAYEEHVLKQILKETFLNLKKIEDNTVHVYKRGRALVSLIGTSLLFGPVAVSEIIFF